MVYFCEKRHLIVKVKVMSQPRVELFSKSPTFGVIVNPLWVNEA